MHVKYSLRECGHISFHFAAEPQNFTTTQAVISYWALARYLTENYGTIRMLYDHPYANMKEILIVFCLICVRKPDAAASGFDGIRMPLIGFGDERDVYIPG